MSEKFTEGVTFMNALAEASFLVRKIAEPAPAGDSVKGAILRAYRKLGSWSHNRTRDVWYADHRISISGDELNHLRAIARQHTETPRDADLAEIKDWIAATEARLQRIDPEYFSHSIEALRASSSAIGKSPGGADREYSSGD